MPAATPEPIRQAIWQAALQGHDAARIAQDLDRPARTVRHLLARFRATGLPWPPRFDRSGRRSSPTFAALRQQALDLRRQHPRWGAQRILTQLLPGDRCEGRPDLSTVRRWLAHAGLAPQPRRRVPAPAPTAEAVHGIWPMDACEGKPLRGGRRVCWLRLLDEASGAALFTRVYDQPRWAAVGGPAVQAALRQAFGRFGRPGGLRVDNGQPWVCPDSDLPSDLELWLAGLDVTLHRGRPGVPQDNPRAERGQRTAQDWAEPWRHDSVEALQKALDEEDRVHREVYLFDGVRTRLAAYPDLRWGGRPYAAGPYWEAVCWDHAAALALLGRLEVVRKVDKDGYVSLYDQRCAAGHGLRGQDVGVRFDAAGQEWVFV
jgi:transposase